MNEKAKSQTRAGHAGIVIKAILAVVTIAALAVAGRTFNLQLFFRDALAWISGPGPLGLMNLHRPLYPGVCAASSGDHPDTESRCGVRSRTGIHCGADWGDSGRNLRFSGRAISDPGMGARLIAGNEKFNAVDEAVARDGWKIVLLTRLSPVFPFILLKYAFGLTRVSLKHYFFASWLGIIPGTTSVRLTF